MQATEIKAILIFWIFDIKCKQDKNKICKQNNNKVKVLRVRDSPRRRDAFLPGNGARKSLAGRGVDEGEFMRNVEWNPKRKV